MRNVYTLILKSDILFLDDPHFQIGSVCLFGCYSVDAVHVCIRFGCYSVDDR